jgi:hypothetical protein
MAKIQVDEIEHQFNEAAKETLIEVRKLLDVPNGKDVQEHIRELLREREDVDHAVRGLPYVPAATGPRRGADLTTLQVVQRLESYLEDNAAEHEATVAKLRELERDVAAVRRVLGTGA